MSGFSTQKLSEPEIRQVLARIPSLSVQFELACQEDLIMNCAHGPDHSFIIMRDRGEWGGFKITGGTKEHRTQAYRGILQKMQATFGGDVRKPIKQALDGRN
jgi:hypothetical protein